jgi:diguanylate cyclase (GGDEF)-like protein
MLTGLFVRHYLDSVIHERQAHEFCGSLVVVDIDQFKQVNDTFGHQTGDQVLKQVSDIVTSSVRPEDICARWGGEELAIYMPQIGARQALEYAEIIRTRVAEETRPPVTVSSGIAEWNWMDEKVSVESLFYRADMALYDAKHGGRNRIVMEEQEVTR